MAKSDLSGFRLLHLDPFLYNKMKMVPTVEFLNCSRKISILPQYPLGVLYWRVPAVSRVPATVLHKRRVVLYLKTKD